MTQYNYKNKGSQTNFTFQLFLLTHNPFSPILFLLRKNPYNEIIGKIEYLKELGERILSHYRQGFSYSQIRRKLLGPEIAIAYFTLGHFTGKNLIRSFIKDQPHMIDTKEGE